MVSCSHREDKSKPFTNFVDPLFVIPKQTHLPEQGADYQTSEHFPDSCGRHHPGNYKMKSIKSKTQTSQFRLTATTTPLLQSQEKHTNGTTWIFQLGAKSGEEKTPQNGGHNKKSLSPKSQMTHSQALGVCGGKIEITTYVNPLSHSKIM